MMQSMLDFCTGMIMAVADFLAAEPMIYLFGFIIIGMALKWVLSLVSLWKY